LEKVVTEMWNHIALSRSRNMGAPGFARRLSLGMVILGAGWLVLGPNALAADSDLAIVCGHEFAAFDRFTPQGRELRVVPWSTEGDLQIAGTTHMPEGQPHAWSIYQRLIIVRTWNDLYIYRVNAQHDLEMILSRKIDHSRGITGGPIAIQVTGNVLRAYGVEHDVVVDLDTCDDDCVAERVAAAPTIPEQLVPRRCFVRKGDTLFAVTEGSTRDGYGTYIDFFLTRRSLSVEGARNMSNPFRPESMSSWRPPYRRRARCAGDRFGRPRWPSSIRPRSPGGPSSASSMFMSAVAGIVGGGCRDGTPYRPPRLWGPPPPRSAPRLRRRWWS
jgi:hypothetical protein